MGKLFGTNGVRGVVGKQMGPALGLDLARALVSFLAEKRGLHRPLVALGRDFRTSSPLLASAVGSGLLASGADVEDLGILPTPALQYHVKRAGAEAPDAGPPGTRRTAALARGAVGAGPVGSRQEPAAAEVSAGVMITASHNPPEFNGIKFIEGDGTEMDPATEEAIEAVYFARSFRPYEWRTCGALRPVSGAARAYNEAIASRVDRAALREAELTVVVDCSNGAACVNLPELVGELGARVVTLNATGDGRFPGHPSEPSPENARDLARTVLERGADLGCIVDGDADRAIFVDEKGRYVWGDRSLALLAGAAVARAKGGKVATPVSTGSCVERVVEAKGGTLVYTVVGAPKVARAMIEMGAVIGGEENGGIVFPEHQHCRDAAMTLARMMELVATSGRTLSDLLEEVPDLALVKEKVHVPDAEKERVLAAVCKELAEGRNGVTRALTMDGVKAFFADGSWVLVRPSGTEPIFRVIVEAKDEAKAKQVAEREKRRVAELASKR